MRKALVWFLLGVLLPFFTPGIAVWADKLSMDFSTRMSRASTLIIRGHVEEGSRHFEELLRDNPDFSLIYETYVTSLERAGLYDEALQVTDRMLKAEEGGVLSVAGVEEVIKRLRDKRAFLERMKDSPRWEDSVSFGGQSFYVTTDIPRSYYARFAERFPAVVSTARRELEALLGPSRKGDVVLEVKLTGNRSTYNDLMKRNSQGLIIYFEGNFNWHFLALQVTHALLRGQYVESPSKLFEEGLGFYVANKLEKASAPKSIHDQLGFFNWRYDNGLIRGLGNVFQRYVQSGSFQEHAFQNDAWSLVRFLVSSEDPVWMSFWGDWKNFEKAASEEEHVSVQRFFFERLGAEGLERLTDAWLDHTLQLTYRDM